MTTRLRRLLAAVTHSGPGYDPGIGVDAEADAWGSVWLHTDWRYVTKQMTTPAKEYAADCVARDLAGLDAADGVPTRAEPDGLRWWRDDR